MRHLANKHRLLETAFSPPLPAPSLPTPHWYFPTKILDPEISELQSNEENHVFHGNFQQSKG